MTHVFRDALNTSMAHNVREGSILFLPRPSEEHARSYCSRAVMEICHELREQIVQAAKRGERIAERGNDMCIPAFRDANGITRALGTHAVEEFWPNGSGDGGGQTGKNLHAEIIAASAQTAADLCIERHVDTKEYNPRFFETYVRILAKRIAVMAALPVSPADPAAGVCFFLREYLFGYAASKPGFTEAHAEKLREMITEELGKYPALLMCAMPRTAP